MIIFAETERLILREMVPADEHGMFALDSDPEVHRYLGNNPITDIDQAREVIKYVRQQYVENGIGRWAVIEKRTNEFVGWSGLKLVKEVTNSRTDFYDVGYRLLKKHWGKGYATESARASLKYGFEVLKLKEIFAAAQIENDASNKVLEKVGLKFIETFDYKGRMQNWYRIKNEEWLSNEINKILY